MFNKDFFPTPADVIDLMLYGVDLSGKVILEPSAGKGDIVDHCIGSGAALVIACENNPDLQKIVSTKCKVIASDFLTVTSDQVSHIDLIIMNPPFSAGEKHILHAWEIAPAGCQVISLCNWEMLDNSYSRSRSIINTIISDFGSKQNLGNCFIDAERKTSTEIGLIKLFKPGSSKDEFEGFFLEEEIEEQENGIMPYNMIRDLVNRYIGAVKLFEKQLELGIQMNNLTSSFFTSKLAFTCTLEGKEQTKSEYKKDLQKSAWLWVFDKMNMQKYTTQSLKSDLNKFVEKQTDVPFTMRNIYKMIEIVVGTQSGRMDKAIIDVFDRLTSHYHDNRFNVEGWKTNSHYLMGEKFILPYMTSPSYSGGMSITHRDNYTSLVEDMVKALCYITGNNYDNYESLWSFLHSKEVPGTEGSYPRQYVRYEWNTWYDWGFFRIKGFKKGTMHFKFKSQEVWAKFNQHVARIKGYPLPESIKNAA